MKRLVLLLGSLLILGVWSLSGPGDISVHHGETLVVTCSYNSNFDNYKKYWCRGDGRSSCHIIVQSQDCGTEGCRASMVDDPRSHRFNVTMVKMRPEDSDTYQCGIERHGLDLMTPMKVSVLPGICRKSSLWEPLVVFPVDFDHIREKEEVEVYCQEKFERRRFLLKCKHVNHTFELQTKDLTPCKKRCTKMGNWGQNVSVDPEQDYYDPDQQVTATCPAGYIPNYSTAKCVRDNETNSWNVTEISCVIRTQSSDLGRNMTTLQRTLLGSCVAGLILPMALKFLTILVLSCAILIQNVRRRDRPTQRGAVANKTRHKDEELNPKEDLTLKRATLCIEALPYTPSPAMRSHKVIYDNMDAMFPPPSRRLPAECK